MDIMSLIQQLLSSGLGNRLFQAMRPGGFPGGGGGFPGGGGGDEGGGSGGFNPPPNGGPFRMWLPGNGGAGQSGGGPGSQDQNGQAPSNYGGGGEASNPLGSIAEHLIARMRLQAESAPGPQGGGYMPYPGLQGGGEPFRFPQMFPDQGGVDQFRALRNGA